MKACKIPVLMFSLTSVALAQNYSINGYVIASGGGHYAHNKKKSKKRSAIPPLAGCMQPIWVALQKQKISE
jgi:hypothetical protein